MEDRDKTHAQLLDEVKELRARLGIATETSERGAVEPLIDLGRLAHALETIADGVVICDHSRRYLFVNAAAERILGLPRNEILRRTYDDSNWAVTKLDGSPVGDDEAATTQTLWTGAVIYGVERLLSLPDGTRRILSYNTAPVRDANGAIVAAVVSFTDVTDRKNAEEALQRSHAGLEERVRQRTDELVTINRRLHGEVEERRRAEEALQHSGARFRLLFERNQAGVITSTLAGRVLDCNAAFCRILGFDTVEEVRSRPASACYADPADRELLMRRLKEEGSLTNFEIRFRNRRGEPVWVLENISLIVDRNEGQVILGTVVDLTERKRTEEALRTSEERFRLLFETSVAGILITTPEGEIVSCNPACARMLGCASAAEARTRDSREFYANPADRDAVLRRLRACGTLANHEVLVRRPGGELVWLLQNITWRRDNTGRETIFSTLIDINERKQAEENLGREREFIRLVLDTDPNLIFVKDAGGRFVMANKALADLYGTTPEALVGHLPGGDLPSPGELAEYRRIEEEVLGTGRSIAVDEVNTRPNGRVYWFHTIKTPLRLPDGTTHVLGIATEITQRKRAEDELRASREWFAAVFSASRDGIVAEAGEHIVYANEAAARLHGYDRPEDMIGRPSSQFLFAEDGPRMLEYGRRRLRGEPVPAVYPFRGLRQDGGVIELEASVSCCRVGGRDHVITIVRDVADRMRLEEQLRQATKLEAVGRLAGGVAHDFNNLLTIILGYTDLLLNNPKIDDIGQRLLREVNRAGERAARLTRQLLAFSRKQILQARAVDINVLVTDMGTMLRPLIGEDVELVTELGVGLGQVRVDPNHLEQAILNLAANARDAMPNGGTLTIQTRNVVLDDEFAADHPEVHPGRYVLLAVSDTGCGMDGATLEHAFEPFFTTKPVGRGTGLGLASVFGTVKQSNGHIEADSEPGRGSTFRIYLPCLAETTPQAVEEVHKTAFPTGTETILLVEDEQAVRALARHVLRVCGYRMLEAPNADEAMRLAGQELAGVQLLLTDVVMPGGSGKLLADELRLRFPALKVLFMSGYAANVLDLHGVEDAGAAFIHKPFTPTELAKKVREVLDR